jgi:heavy metal sensor kinase
MSFATKHARSKLSSRLTRVYAALFCAIFFVMSVFVFLLAYRFLVQRQHDHLVNTMELIGDNLLEELEEGESLSSPEVLQELNVDPNLSIFIYDEEDNLINRALNFPLPRDLKHKSGRSPEPFLYQDTLMLRASHPISEHEVSYGKLNLVYSMSNESAFLKLLGLLLLGANLAGMIVSFLVSRAVSRKMLEPIGSMIAAANQIDRTTLDDRLAVPEPDDELQHLAMTLNGMLDRVSAAYHQQGRFVADVSHELRTPLAVMQGNVDLLSRWGGEDQAVRTDSIQALAKQTTYMSALVENLLFLARSDNAQFRLDKTTFSVSELFAELLEEQSLIDPAHDYTSAVAPENAAMMADRAMIGQMLRALVDNSVKYTPEGGSIALGFTQEGQTYSLTVHDSGVGMAEEDCAHIFERFYRVDEARARVTGGMGLGLSLVLAIAQSHGGTARARSTPGCGTTITVTIPS